MIWRLHLMVLDSYVCSWLVFSYNLVEIRPHLCTWYKILCVETQGRVATRLSFLCTILHWLLIHVLDTWQGKGLRIEARTICPPFRKHLYCVYLISPNYVSECPIDDKPSDNKASPKPIIPMSLYGISRPKWFEAFQFWGAVWNCQIFINSQKRSIWNALIILFLIILYAMLYFPQSIFNTGNK